MLGANQHHHSGKFPQLTRKGNYLTLNIWSKSRSYLSARLHIVLGEGEGLGKVRTKHTIEIICNGDKDNWQTG